MNENNETKKSRNITFRLTQQQYDEIERAALAAGDEPNSWSRRVVLTQLTEGFGLSKNDRLMYEEIARVRYLVGNGFRLLIGSEGPNGTTWRKVTAQADQRIEMIADDLLSRRNKQPPS
jgi:hypothetical protein